MKAREKYQHNKDEFEQIVLMYYLGNDIWRVVKTYEDRTCNTTIEGSEVFTDWHKIADVDGLEWEVIKTASDAEI
jgi:hypothetical protein